MNRDETGHARIVLNGAAITYAIRRSPRAKRIRLTVHAGGEVVLTVPARVRWITRAMIDARAERFVQDHAAWLVRKIDEAAAAAAERHRRRRHAGGLHDARRAWPAGGYRRHKAPALALATRLVGEKFAALYERHESHRPPAIRIRIGNQKTMWGSCSRKGTLSFNFRMLFLPEPLQEYLVVHELSHLREFNHSPRFWALVAALVPDYAARRRELREYGLGEG